MNKNDYYFVLNAIKNNDFEFQFILKKFRYNYEIVLEAVKHNGLVLKYTSKKLQDNKEIVITALKNDIEAFYYVSDNLKEKIRLKLADWCPYGCRSNDDKTINSLNNQKHNKKLDINIFEE